MKFHVIFVTDDGIDPETRAERIAKSMDAFSVHVTSFCTEAHDCLTLECEEEDRRTLVAALHSHLDDCLYERKDSEHVTGFTEL